MFISPYFGGCKYTNNFLFINKKAEFQHIDLLITLFNIISNRYKFRTFSSPAIRMQDLYFALHLSFIRKFLYIWKL